MKKEKKPKNPRPNFPSFQSFFQSKNYLKMQARSQGVSVVTLGAPLWLYVPPDQNDH